MSTYNSPPQLLHYKRPTLKRNSMVPYMDIKEDRDRFVAFRASPHSPGRDGHYNLWANGDRIQEHTFGDWSFSASQTETHTPRDLGEDYSPTTTGNFQFIDIQEDNHASHRLCNFDSGPFAVDILSSRQGLPKMALEMQHNTDAPSDESSISVRIFDTATLVEDTWADIMDEIPEPHNQQSCKPTFTAPAVEVQVLCSHVFGVKKASDGPRSLFWRQNRLR